MEQYLLHEQFLELKNSTTDRSNITIKTFETQSSQQQVEIGEEKLIKLQKCNMQYETPKKSQQQPQIFQSPYLENNGIFAPYPPKKQQKLGNKGPTNEKLDFNINSDNEYENDIPDNPSNFSFKNKNTNQNVNQELVNMQKQEELVNNLNKLQFLKSNYRQCQYCCAMASQCCYKCNELLCEDHSHYNNNYSRKAFCQNCLPRLNRILMRIIIVFFSVILIVGIIVIILLL